MTGDERMAALTEAAATHAVKQHDPHAVRRRRFGLVAAVVLAASLLGGGTWVALTLTELQAQADDNAVIAHRLGEQVRDLGGTPVVQPPAVDDPDPDDPDPDDADPDDPERQDDEIQDPEQQDPETQDPELQDPEVADDERDDPDPDDPEIQDEEIQDPEIDDQPVPPASWTWVDGDGRTQTCTRTGGPNTAPTYTCTAEPPPETVPGLPIARN